MKSSDTIVFLKDGRYFDNVIDMLSETGFSDESQIAIAQDVSTKENILEIKQLKDIRGKKPERYETRNERYISSF